jgi:hypothetical protein
MFRFDTYNTYKKPLASYTFILARKTSHLFHQCFLHLQLACIFLLSQFRSNSTCQNVSVSRSHFRSNSTCQNVNVSHSHFQSNSTCQNVNVSRSHFRSNSTCQNVNVSHSHFQSNSTCQNVNVSHSHCQSNSTCQNVTVSHHHPDEFWEATFKLRIKFCKHFLSSAFSKHSHTKHVNLTSVSPSFKRV